LIKVVWHLSISFLATPISLSINGLERILKLTFSKQIGLNCLTLTASCHLPHHLIAMDNDQTPPLLRYWGNNMENVAPNLADTRIVSILLKMVCSYDLQWNCWNILISLGLPWLLLLSLKFLIKSKSLPKTIGRWEFWQHPFTILLKLESTDRQT
jgi:hypothetical protein